MMSDPLADLLIRIKNARLAKHDQLAVPHSRLKEELVKLLVKTGYLGSYAVKDKNIIIAKPKLSRATRLSKPGSRLYAGVADLPRYLRGRGQTILSTAKGLMTAREAVRQKVGGELLCRIA